MTTEVEELKLLLQNRNRKIVSLENIVEGARIDTDNLRTGIEIQNATIHDLQRVNDRLTLELEVINGCTRRMH